MSDRIDEQAARREDFKGGSPVVLADGQTWSFARPVVVFRADDDSESGFVTALDLEGDDGAYADLMRKRDAAWAAIGAARAARDAGGEPDPAGAQARHDAAVGADVRIGALLLKRNYALTTAQVGALMPFSFDEGTAPSRIYEEVMAVARGNGPKPDAGGGD